ncbi:WXG100 family type VII secretion target [Streptomyces sp. NPDC059918]|uniref:WXG100 family type VII secretion target n=1 Tax=unclassified Streptomyces TaxID=2593676 RepID=UPI003657FAC0
MSGYTLSPDELSSSAQRVDQSAQDIQGMFNHLHSALEGFANQWQGDAATVFSNLAAQIHGNGQRFQRSLQTISENLKSAG